MDNKHKILVAVLLSVLLVLSPILTGCGSLTRIISQPESPRETGTPALSNLLRTGKDYDGIEILHATREEPAFSPDEKGYFYEDRGWIYLFIEGSPEERGYQHGWLLADYIQLQIDHNVSMLATTEAIDWGFLRAYVERAWTNKVGDEYRAELAGIVKGASERGATFDYLDLLVMNGLEELRECWFPTVQGAYFKELAAGAWNPENAAAGVEVSLRDAGNAADDGGQDEEAAADDAQAENSDSDATTSDSEEAESEDSAGAGAMFTEGESNATEEADEADAEDESTKEESDKTDPIGLLPFVDINGLTQLSEGAVIKKYTPTAGAYTRQAVAVLAAGSATKDGSLVLAHNSIAAYADSNFSNVIINVAPSEGIQFSMQSAPGLIHSVGQAYSTTNLLIANVPISGFNVYTEEGVPEFIRARKAAQYATSLDEFTSYMLAGNNGGLAASWLVGDLTTNQIMELELGLSFYQVQKLVDGGFVGFGGVDDVRILNFETDGSGFTDTRQGNASRHVRLLSAFERDYGDFDAASAQALISDHFDAYTNRSNAGSRSICAHYDLDDAEFSSHTGVEPNMPFGTVGALVMTSEMAKENTVLARWGSACGRTFDSAGYLNRNPQYGELKDYLYDRPSQFWSELSPFE